MMTYAGKVEKWYDNLMNDQTMTPGQQASSDDQTTVRIYHTDVLQPAPQEEANDTQTNVRYISGETAPMPVMSEAFKSTFQDIFQEVLQPEGEAVVKPESSAQELSSEAMEVQEIEQKIEDVSRQQSERAILPVSAPQPPMQQVPQQPVAQVAGMTPISAQNIAATANAHTAEKSVVWLAMLVTKVFKMRGMTS